MVAGTLCDMSRKFEGLNVGKATRAFACLNCLVSWRHLLHLIDVEAPWGVRVISSLASEYNDWLFSDPWRKFGM